MPALNFQKQFAAKVEDGSKPHTIRADRKHPIKAGDTLYLYTGMRSLACRPLRAPEICNAVVRITIDTDRCEVLLGKGSTIHRCGGGLLTPAEIERLAKLDGFDDVNAFFKWFRDIHGATFRGTLIEWKPMNAEIPLFIKNPELDFELSDLLGEKPGDFIVLCIDGQQVPFAGTPYDSPRAREIQQLFVDRLNDRSKKSLWPEYFTNWKPYFCQHYKLPPETTAETYHPTFSFAISRVCAGYSKHLHVAIGIFAELGGRVKSWTVAKADNGAEIVEIVSAAGAVYRETGEGMARLISQAAVRLLRELPNTR